jgi:hypothetical protein
VGRLVIRVFLGVLVAAAVAYGIAWVYFAEPTPESQFFFAGNAVVDLRFSPDGKKLAVISFETPPPDAAKFQVARIFRISDGEVLHSIPNAAWKSAWNSDGSLLATVESNGTDFEVWETAKWGLKRHLTLTAQSAGHESRAHNPVDAEGLADISPGIVQRLCFNRQGSLFTVSFAQDSDSASEYNHAKIWWDPLGKETVAESIGSCGGPCDLAVAGSGKSPLVALAYKTPCNPEVVKIGLKSGKTVVENKVVLKDLPDKLDSPRLEMTADGRLLLARDTTQFDIFSISDTAVQLVQSIASKAPIVKGSMLWFKHVEISGDGRFAAYDTEGHLNIIRLPDGKPVLTISHPPCAVALAADGSMVAIADQSTHSVLLYRIPGGGSGSADGVNSAAQE